MANFDLSKLMSKDELQSITFNRVTNYDHMVETVFDRVLDFSFEFKREPNISNTYLKGLVFKGCTFNGDIIVRSSFGSIFFENCIFNAPVQAFLYRPDFQRLCLFNKELRLKCDQPSSISSFSVNGLFLISGQITNVTDVNLHTLVDNQKIVIDADVICQSITFENINCDYLELKRLPENTLVKIKNVEAKGFSANNALKFQVEESRLFNLQFSSLCFSSLVISKNSLIHTLKLRLDCFKEIDIFDSGVGSLELSGTNNSESKVSIQKTELQNLTFKKVYNNGLMSLRELIIEDGGIVSFRSSNLGKTDFINCNFSKGELEFENSKITEAFFSETDFPKDIHTTSVKNYSQAQLAFGQIATAFQKQGDTVRALEYNSREIEAHYQGLKWLSSDILNKFNLWLNLISNNFGRNWMRGVFFTFGVGSIFFCFLLISTDKYQFGDPTMDFGFIPAFLNFMNPLRFVSTENLFKDYPGMMLSPWSYLLDFLARIFIAYGFYQTIQAFRRFGRK